MATSRPGLASGDRPVCWPRRPWPRHRRPRLVCPRLGRRHRHLDRDRRLPGHGDLVPGGPGGPGRRVVHRGQLDRGRDGSPGTGRATRAATAGDHRARPPRAAWAATAGPGAAGSSTILGQPPRRPARPTRWSRSCPSAPMLTTTACLTSGSGRHLLDNGHLSVSGLGTPGSPARRHCSTWTLFGPARRSTGAAPAVVWAGSRWWPPGPSP